MHAPCGRSSFITKPDPGLKSVITYQVKIIKASFQLILFDRVTPLSRKLYTSKHQHTTSFAVHPGYHSCECCKRPDPRGSGPQMIPLLNMLCTTAVPYSSQQPHRSQHQQQLGHLRRLERRYDRAGRVPAFCFRIRCFIPRGACSRHRYKSPCRDDLGVLWKGTATVTPVGAAIHATGGDVHRCPRLLG